MRIQLRIGKILIRNYLKNNLIENYLIQKMLKTLKTIIDTKNNLNNFQNDQVYLKFRTLFLT
jgi:hypothetical protein